MAIQDKMKKLVDDYCMPIIGNVEKERFLPDLDFDMMYREMYWACEGYLNTIMQSGHIDLKQAEDGFQKLLDFGNRYIYGGNKNGEHYKYSESHKVLWKAQRN